MDPRVKAGIFAGESGGDYDALFGFSNRPGGRFAGTRISDMTVDEAINFANPKGPYAQWVKSQIGRVATPMGGFQIVGTTLKAAKRIAGLSGSERMTPEIQDRLGDVILAQQGTRAWEGYRGPREPTAGTSYRRPAEQRYDPRSDTPSPGRPTSADLENAPTSSPFSGPLTARHPPNPMVGVPGPNELNEAPLNREDLAALALMGNRDTSSASDILKNIGKGFGQTKISMGQAPQMQQLGFTQAPQQPLVDPQQAEQKRQMLAMAMQRMFPQGGMG